MKHVWCRFSQSFYTSGKSNNQQNDCIGLIKKRKEKERKIVLDHNDNLDHVLIMKCQIYQIYNGSTLSLGKSRVRQWEGH